MRQQIVPEDVAAKDQDVFGPLAFEFGNLLVSGSAADDAGVLPRFRLFRSQAVRYDDFVYGVVEPRYLPMDGPGLRIVRDGRPEPLEPIVRRASQQQRIG